MPKEGKETRQPKFKGTIAYVQRPIEGVALYRKPSEESLDDELEKLDRQDIDVIKKQELINRIKARAAEAEQRRLELEGKGKVAPMERRFTIIDNKPVLDPEGEYTFSEALRTCALAAGDKAGVSGDKVSDILGAIKPFVDESRGAAREVEEKKQETSLAMVAIEALKEKGGGQQPLTVNDMITLFSKLNEITTARSAQEGQPPAQRTIMDDLTQLGSIFETLQRVFGGGSRGEGPPTVLVTLPGTDGKGGIPMDTFMKWDEHQWNRRKEEVKFQDDRENAKAIRNFAGKLGKAADAFSRRAGAEEA